jgi:hypothetical protein
MIHLVNEVTGTFLSAGRLGRSRDFQKYFAQQVKYFAKQVKYFAQQVSRAW